MLFVVYGAQLSVLIHERSFGLCGFILLAQSVNFYITQGSQFLLLANPKINPASVNNFPNYVSLVTNYTIVYVSLKIFSNSITTNLNHSLVLEYLDV